MRFLILTALSAAAASASAQSVTLVATFDGKPVGSGTFTIQQGSDHSFVQTTSFNIQQNGQKEQLTSVVKVSFDGLTLQDDEKDVLNGTVQKNFTVTFNTRVAQVLDRVSGKTSTYPIPSAASVKDIGGLWFVSVRPHAGAISSATAFGVDSMSWRKTTRTYISDEPITLNGLKVNGHKLRDSDGTQTIDTVVDDHGLPLLMDVAGFHFARK